MISLVMLMPVSSLAGYQTEGENRTQEQRRLHVQRSPRLSVELVPKNRERREDFDPGEIIPFQFSPWPGRSV